MRCGARDIDSMAGEVRVALEGGGSPRRRCSSISAEGGRRVRDGPCEEAVLEGRARPGCLGQMNRERGFSILEIILDLTKDLKND
jgi:hypothetical protein